ncbi:MAG: TIR domain-containing protein [Gammaproteobacteria bacterium]
MQESAKNKIKNAEKSVKRNVFISFAYEDLDDVNLLRGQARNDNSDIEFNDRSLHEPFDSKNAEYIKQGIRNRIKQSSMTIVYLSAAAAASKWVDTEIQMSIDMGKKVVAMHSGPTPPAKLPAKIGEHGISVVKWGKGQLAKAITAHSDEK